MKLGVALSGGGIKSFSQIPVLKALEQESMDISYIVERQWEVPLRLYMRVVLVRVL